MNNVSKEIELYEGMCQWLHTYLNDKYAHKRCEIVVVDCHSVNLDSVLEKYGIIKYYPQVVGLKIEIDVLGMVIWDNRAEIYFIEAKKNSINSSELRATLDLLSPLRSRRGLSFIFSWSR